MDNKKSKTISWEQLQAMGNPENAPQEIKEKSTPKQKREGRVRVYLERKGRGGKTVSVIKGIEMNHTQLESYCKNLKSKIGTGGSTKNGEIIIQGDQRKRILELLQKDGFKDCKNAGA